MTNSGVLSMVPHDAREMRPSFSMSILRLDLFRRQDRGEQVLNCVMEGYRFIAHPCKLGCTIKEGPRVGVHQKCWLFPISGERDIKQVSLSEIEDLHICIYREKLFQNTLHLLRAVDSSYLRSCAGRRIAPLPASSDTRPIPLNRIGVCFVEISHRYQFPAKPHCISKVAVSASSLKSLSATRTRG